MSTHLHNSTTFHHFHCYHPGSEHHAMSPEHGMSPLWCIRQFQAENRWQTWTVKEDITKELFTEVWADIGLPWWLSSEESAYSAGDAGSIPGLERSPGGGNDNPLQNSCLGNPMDRGARRAKVYEVAKSQTWLKWLSTHAGMSRC